MFLTDVCQNHFNLFLKNERQLYDSSRHLKSEKLHIESENNDMTKFINVKKIRKFVLLLLNGTF